jgi:hypothetical protein
MTVALAEAHVGGLMNSHFDCVHFCSPGVPEVGMLYVTYVLYDSVIVLQCTWVPGAVRGDGIHFFSPEESGAGCCCGVM